MRARRPPWIPSPLRRVDGGMARQVDRMSHVADVINTGTSKDSDTGAVVSMANDTVMLEQYDSSDR